jgi:hypothetical protein
VYEHWFDLDCSGAEVVPQVGAAVLRSAVAGALRRGIIRRTLIAVRDVIVVMCVVV